MVQFTSDAAKEERKREILLAAFVELRTNGYSGTSMLSIARRARASKETLYAWFGNKPGLFAELVQNNAVLVQQVLRGSLSEDQKPQNALSAFGEALLRLLLGEAAVCLNRAAITETERDRTLADIINLNGREATLPLLTDYLDRQKAAGTLDFDDALTAAQLLIGVLMGDAQVRRLLNVLPEPDDDWIEDRVERAVSVFLKLYGTGPEQQASPS